MIIINYQGILEEGIIKQREMKENLRTRKTKLCRMNLIKAINILARAPCEILWNILKIDNGKIQTNGPKDMKTDNYALGLTPER